MSCLSSSFSFPNINPSIDISIMIYCRFDILIRRKRVSFISYSNWRMNKVINIFLCFTSSGRWDSFCCGIQGFPVWLRVLMMCMCMWFWLLIWFFFEKRGYCAGEGWGNPYAVDFAFVVLFSFTFWVPPVPLCNEKQIEGTSAWSQIVFPIFLFHVAKLCPCQL